MKTSELENLLCLLDEFHTLAPSFGFLRTKLPAEDFIALSELSQAVTFIGRLSILRDVAQAAREGLSTRQLPIPEISAYILTLEAILGLMRSANDDDERLNVLREFASGGWVSELIAQLRKMPHG